MCLTHYWYIRYVSCNQLLQFSMQIFQTLQNDHTLIEDLYFKINFENLGLTCISLLIDMSHLIKV